MEKSKVDMFIVTMSSKFPNEKLMIIREKLEEMDDNKFIVVQSANYYDPVLLLILSILIGTLGIDRMLLGQVGLGILKLITCGGFFIWYIVDFFLIMNETKEYNFKKFWELTSY